MNGPLALPNSAQSTWLLVGASVLGVLFAGVQPDADSIGTRALAFVQWQCQTVGPMLLLITARNLLAALSHRTRADWVVLAGAGIVAVVAFTPVALGIDILFGVEPVPPSWAAALLDELLGFAPPALTCWWLLNVVSPDRCANAQSVIVCAGRAPSEQGLNAKLPVEIRGSPRLIKAELQYLDVTTDRGSALVLYSLRDAIGELGEDLGLQPHRSYWVRYDQIERLEPSGRQGQLVLMGGLRIPVSRQRLKAVRALLNKHLR